MATPAEYLPPALSDASIRQLMRSVGLPEPRAVQSLQVAADYHSVYLVHFDVDQAGEIAAHKEPDGSVTLVLRVSGRHLPRIKTLNEVGVMTWIGTHTTIPVPPVVRFDATEDNPISHEYTLLEKAPGVSVDSIYDTLDGARKRFLVEQLTDYLIQLHSSQRQIGFVGGLVPSSSKSGGAAVVPGPAIDETYWQLPDIRRYWPADETLESLNPLDGPFPSWTAHAASCLARYMHALATHPSLAPHRDLLPHLNALRTLLAGSDDTAPLNSTTYVLAHRDLHFANVMADPATARITAVLDWEFASVVPAPRWDPVRAFLWSGRRTDEVDAAADAEEKCRLRAMFEEVCAAKGAGWLLDQIRPSEVQEALATVVGHVRAIVEVCPRGGAAADKVLGWKAIAETAMKKIEELDTLG